MKHKPIHSSWKKLAEKQGFNPIDSIFYFKGAKDFRKKSLEALNIFSVLTNEPPVIYNNKMYVSLDDVKELIKGLYANTGMQSRKIKNDE